MSGPWQLYSPIECGPDGYPRQWHTAIKHQVREEAGYRCVRCLHPYTRSTATIEQDPETGKPVNWSPCDARCQHGDPARDLQHPFGSLSGGTTTGELISEAAECGVVRRIEAAWRILTVHHLDKVKGNCRWWNLVALCQRCHLQIQGKVQMTRVWPWEHSDWFKPYVAGYYAFVYFGEELDRPTVESRLEELLALEQMVGAS